MKANTSQTGPIQNTHPSESQFQEFDSLAAAHQAALEAMRQRTLQERARLASIEQQLRERALKNDARLQQLEGRLTQMAAVISERDEEERRLQAAAEEAKRLASGMQGQLESAYAEIERLNAEVRRLQPFEAKQSELEVALGQVQKLQHEVLAYQSLIKRYEHERAALYGEIARSRRAFASIKTQVEYFRNELAVVSRERDAARKEKLPDRLIQEAELAQNRFRLERQRHEETIAAVAAELARMSAANPFAERLKANEQEIERLGQEIRKFPPWAEERKTMNQSIARLQDQRTFIAEAISLFNSRVEEARINMGRAAISEK